MIAILMTFAVSGSVFAAQSLAAAKSIAQAMKASAFGLNLNAAVAQPVPVRTPARRKVCTLKA